MRYKIIYSSDFRHIHFILLTTFVLLEALISAYLPVSSGMLLCRVIFYVL